MAAPPASLWILWLPWVYPGNPGYPPRLSIPDLLNLLSPLCHGRQHSPGFQELGCGHLGEGGHYSASLSPVPSSLPLPCASVFSPVCLPCVPLLLYIMQERKQFTQRNIQFWRWSWKNKSTHNCINLLKIFVWNFKFHVIYLCKVTITVSASWSRTSFQRIYCSYQIPLKQYFKFCFQIGVTLSTTTMLKVMCEMFFCVCCVCFPKVNVLPLDQKLIPLTAFFTGEGRD